LQFLKELYEKFPIRLLLLTGGFSITQAGFFVCYCTITEHFATIISNINFDVPGQDFCLQSFLTFQVFAKVPKIGTFGLSKRHEKIHHLAIFLYFRVVIWLPFLNAKGDCDTLSHLSSRAI